MTRKKSALLLCASIGAGVLSGGPARADEGVIKHPGRHPDYSFEAEPHFFFGFDPPGKTAGRGYGPGFRGTIELVDNGFVKSINNTVGLGFGFDWIAFTKDKQAVFIPFVMQWNFWLSRNWSVFGEPGWGLYLGNATGVRPAGYAGGRFHFSEKIALTLRIGYPAVSLGASFVF
ncbi:MAG: hypothetical protein IPI67_19685 [Myxococcales bacterium]|nr:hypothetical protein [Myxococcales bacterium]